MLLVQACQVLDEQRQPVGKATQADPPLLQLLECRQVGLGVVHDDQPVAQGYQRSHPWRAPRAAPPPT